MTIKLSQIKHLALASTDLAGVAPTELRDFLSENAEECALAFGTHPANLREVVREFPPGDPSGLARAILKEITRVQRSGRSTKHEAKAFAAVTSADAMASAMRPEWVDGAVRMEVDLASLRACAVGDILTFSCEYFSLEVTLPMARISDLLAMLKSNRRCANACAYVDAKGFHVEWNACSSGRWTRGGVNVSPMAEVLAIRDRRAGAAEIRVNVASERVAA